MTSPAAAVTARRLLLQRPDATMNGVDFASGGHSHPARLEVHFINRIRIRGTLAQSRAPVTLTSDAGLPQLSVHPIDERTAWSTDTSGRPVLHLTVDPPAASARYLLTIPSDRLDPRFQQAAVSIGQPPGVCTDCTAPAEAPPGSEPAVMIDYLAKDFQSFCAALSGFSAARYPQWIERSEADMGVMLMEALSALADELSYQQDRVAAEATLDTATQPRSLLRLARLVDYEPAQPRAAVTTLQLDVAGPFSSIVRCQAAGDQGQPVDFAAGPGLPGLAAADDGSQPGLDPRWNRFGDTAGTRPVLVPYLWDASRQWLRQGATAMWISGHGHGCYPGQALLLDTAGPAGGDPPAREIVRVTEMAEETDPRGPRDVTLIRWATGLRYDHDLTRTEVAGNLITAVQGRMTEEEFVIPGAPGTAGAAGSLAVVRSGPGGSAAEYLYTLAASPAWLPVPVRDGGGPGQRPAISVSAAATDATGSADLGTGAGAEVAWQWVRRLLDADIAARVFTITPERYSPAPTAEDPSFYDYDGGGGTTICFGDGAFGRAPVPGTTFRASYLTGGGAAGNVGADTILIVAPGHLDPPVWRCANPFAATGGTDAETAAQIRDRAPQQFRAGLLSLAGPADYEAAALSFSPGEGAAWARQARAAFRWTGSWLSALTLVDPMADEPAGTQLSALADLAKLLDVRRLAGWQSSVGTAQYLWLDLHVTARAEPARRRPDVEAAVLSVLEPWPRTDGSTGFFGRDRWTFGQPLEASALATVIQSCPGVAGVTLIEYRTNVAAARWRPLPDTLRIDPDQILRIDNDRNRPEHGMLSVTAEVTP